MSYDGLEIPDKIESGALDDLLENIEVACRNRRSQKPAENSEWIERARTQHGSDDKIDIDDDARVSVGDDKGAYVQAWVWVDDPA